MARKPKGRRRRNDDAGKHTLLHLNFSNKDLTDSSRYPKKVCDSKSVAPIAKSYKVSNASEKYWIAEPNGGASLQLPIIILYKGLTYEFDFSDSSMVGNIFRLSTEVDGPHEGEDQYTNGWTEFGTPGNADARAFFTVPSSVPSKLYYYDNNFDGYGGDGSKYIKLETLGQVGYSTGVYKSESVSADFSGDGFALISGYGYDHAADLNLKDDFSLSFWMKAKQTGENIDQCLFDFGELSGYIKSGDQLSISMPTRGQATASGWSATEVDQVADLRNNIDIDVSKWNHICVARESGFLSYYINGTGQGAPIPFTGKVFPTGNSSSGEYFSIGATRNYKDFYTGYIDDFFIHDINIYGRDGFIPSEEDVSGKFSAASKDGLTAKFNNYKIYLISDGGYRAFEMYNTDSLNTKLPAAGNIILKDSKDFADQYIYPFSGQNVIISFLKNPDVLDPKDSTVKFYCDFGTGRELVADSKGLVSDLDLSVDPSFGNVTLLIQSDTTDGSTTFTDSSIANHSIAYYGDVKHSINEVQWGNSSIYFDGISDYLIVPHHTDFNFDTSDVTIEFWWKHDGHSTHEDDILSEDIAVLFKGERVNTTYTSWSFRLGNPETPDLNVQEGHLAFSAMDGFDGGENLISANRLDDGNWYHIAVTRENATEEWSFFVDGVLQDSFIDTTHNFDTSEDLMIGAGRKFSDGSLGYYGNFYLEDLRITKGVARYTDNFTSPTTSFAKNTTRLSLGKIHNYAGESYFTPKKENNIQVITDLRPQWRYNTTGNIDVNGVHLLINNIQTGFTGTWTAEHWADGSVFSTPRKVIIKDVIDGTGCVRPQITGFNGIGQIMALANPDLSYVSVIQPTWTGTCGGFDNALGNLDADYKSSTYKFPNNDSTGVATHYRIFSGWLDGNSLPSFEEVDGARYDGSTDNSNIKFVIREEPLGPTATTTVGDSITQGSKNHNADNQFYREMTYAEVSGTPVTPFKYFDPITRKLYQSSGRLLISGDGNSTDDNGVNGQTCMYITAIDTVASDSCYISNSKEISTCFEKCPDAIGPLTEVPSISVRCSGNCAGTGYIQAGYKSTSGCEAGCVECGGSWPWRGIQAPIGQVKVKEGEILHFNAAAKRGNVSWCGYTKEEWDANYPSKVDEVIKCQDGNLSALGYAGSFNWMASGAGGPSGEMVFVPIYSYKDPNESCDGLKIFGSEVNVTVEERGDVSFAYPNAPINIQMKAGEVGRLTTNTNGAKPISYKWYRGLESSPLTTSTKGQNNLNIGIISGSDCYHVKAWNGGVGDYVNNYRNMDISEPICIECVEEKSQSQCCLASTTRTFEITGSNSCKIASIKAYELWPNIMGSYADDYTNGRVIVPEVTSASDKSWTTKWHYGNGGVVDGVCYNSGASISESQNNRWCSNNISGIDKCFTVSGCPDKIVYEVTTYEPLVDKAYSDYYNNSYRNKRLERQVFFEESPLGQTGNLQVEYASSAFFTGDCPCAAPRKLNLNFPPYIGSPQFTGGMSAGEGIFIPTGSREDGVVEMNVGSSGAVCWNSSTGAYGHSGFFNWYTGATEQIRGSGFFSEYGANSSTKNPHGAPDKGNYEINFTGNLNEWDITIMANRAGIEGTGQFNYATYYVSGETTGSFVRTLKDNYMNIRSGNKHEILDLGGLVPATTAATGSGIREVDIYTNTDTQKLVFFVNQVDYVDSNPLLSGSDEWAEANQSGYNQYQSASVVASWAHQTVNTSPFLIRSGYVNTFTDEAYSTFSGCSGSVGGGYDANLACKVQTVTSKRNSTANVLSNAEWDRAADKNLDLWAILETGDVLGVKIVEPSGWNSYMHGKMLILDQPTGIWKNWTGAAQNPFFRTFVNGQEV